MNDIMDEPQGEDPPDRELMESAEDGTPADDEIMSPDGDDDEEGTEPAQ